MPESQTADSLLAQGIILQLDFCLKALDHLGMDVTAAHVDAAIQSFRNESPLDISGEEAEARG